MLSSSDHVSLPLASILSVAFAWLQCDTAGHMICRKNRESYTIQHHFQEDCDLNREDSH